MLSAVSPAVADGKVVCPPDGGGDCQVVVTVPGQPGGDHPGGDGRNPGARECVDTLQNVKVPCYLQDLGWWSPNCYYKAMAPQPPAGDPAWEGHKPGDGAVYDAYCPDEGLPVQWRATPPPGADGGVDPAQLAAEAVKRLPIDGPDIGVAPSPGNTGVVGMPVWLWNRTSPRTWGPTLASASAGGVTVTATAHVWRIQWDMGDGHTVTCGAGTPYKASYGGKESPDCGYRYTTTSNGGEGEVFWVTATATWDVHWAGGGQRGDLTTTRSSQVQLRVGEVQVLGQ
ncbi:ATP/GTP-binding protein [Streptomyces sp. MI02-7b]|uniref:ATP/GTP-binding protein n=1 Tax=Streptomyces sp. MI02-7b TaxID=462941 RepID=UPI0029B99724|nr:ATP/GTP-binding protein [Streptomyces sp. MI02-7b]MDX3075890.1 ATP/GTP-binding protein [Streptomyces sp. MI02-7b]